MKASSRFLSTPLSLRSKLLVRMLFDEIRFWLFSRRHFPFSLASIFIRWRKVNLKLRFPSTESAFSWKFIVFKTLYNFFVSALYVCGKNPFLTHIQNLKQQQIHYKLCVLSDYHCALWDECMEEGKCSSFLSSFTLSLSHGLCGNQEKIMLW